jgi:hypothetical protein
MRFESTVVFNVGAGSRGRPVVVHSDSIHRASSCRIWRPPAAVRTVIVSQQDLPVEIRAIGNVDAYSSVAVKSRGRPAYGRSRSGRPRRPASQLLFEIDPLST